MDDIVVIIPAFNPDKKLMTEFVKGVTEEFKNIIIINDGSKSEFKIFFAELALLPNICMISHCINLGKGQALKTAINYAITNFPNCKAIVTADCDGQHTVTDIKNCAKKALRHPKKLILGCRDFNKDDVPPRSKFGNKITRNVFKLFIGLKITDTQTGLRAMSYKLATVFLETKGSRYEYETNVLIDCKAKDIEILEVPIQTIYIDSNATSHFNPLKDSFSIYKNFAKYIISSLSSFLIDIILFTIFLSILNNNNVDNSILISTICARIISSFYNFVINAKLVFKKMNNKSLIKYVFLVIIQMFSSGFIVSILSKFIPISATILKIIVDLFIFIINFILQREWIFKKKK